MDDNERHLLVQISRWRRDNGDNPQYYKEAGAWTYEDENSYWRVATPSQHPETGEWIGDFAVKPGVSKPWLWMTEQVTSVTQGVDILVAFGLLPVQFSSAYRAAVEDMNLVARSENVWRDLDREAALAWDGPDA